MNVLVPQVIALGKDQLAIVRSYVGGAIQNILPFIAKDQIYQAIPETKRDQVIESLQLLLQAIPENGCCK